MEVIMVGKKEKNYIVYFVGKYIYVDINIYICSYENMFLVKLRKWQNEKYEILESDFFWRR